MPVPATLADELSQAENCLGGVGVGVSGRLTGES